MTGEITLHGKVLPIGGLKEKTMAAYKAGVKTVCIPKENEPDLAECEKVVTDNVKFVIAENITTVLDTALVKPCEAKLERETDSADKKAAAIPTKKRGGTPKNLTVN